MAAGTLWVVSQASWRSSHSPRLFPLYRLRGSQSPSAADPIQTLWLHSAYNLEFLGLSTFVPGLFASSLFFFAVNVWILGIIVGDIGRMGEGKKVVEKGVEGSDQR